jgi:hypothetical protein
VRPAIRVFNEQVRAVPIGGRGEMSYNRSSAKALIVPIIQLLVLLLAAPSAHAQQSAQPRPAVPIDPVPAIIDAFQTHSVVAITDAHGVEQAQAFLISLVRDRRFTDTVNDIVVEFGSARYQNVMDRFVSGEDVPYETLRKVWQDTTQATAGNEAPINEEFFRAVRAANALLPPARRLRVLLGDPPIEWERVRTKEDHRTWIEMREWYPAAVLQLEVLAKGRRALLVYGNGHLQRRNVMSNYEMTDRRTHSIVSVLEHATGTRVFVIWRIGGGEKIQPDIASWPAPRLAMVRGTVLGAADFAEYSPGSRFAIRNGEVVPLPQSEWRVVRAEEQIDAVLYLGPQSSFTESKLSRARCADQAYIDMRLKRIALAGLPPAETDALKRHCASIVK